MYHRPFETGHGAREGTDVVFVRLERNGHSGFGEVALPPYLAEDRYSVLRALQAMRAADLETDPTRVPTEFLTGSPTVRAVITMATADLKAKELGIPVSALFEITGSGRNAKALVTLGICPVQDIPERLDEIEAEADIVKVKLNGNEDQARMERILQHDDRNVFVDANQSWTTVQQALQLVAVIPVERLVGIEQPFNKDEPGLHKDLQQRIPDVPIIADESVQGPADLEHMIGSFGGVNIKLTKCGGLDHAIAMAELARNAGMVVMLGSMSEGALGCAAACQLSTLADLADLDGPWLVRNDPFTGMQLGNGVYTVGPGPGFGVVLETELEFNPIGT